MDGILALAITAVAISSAAIDHRAACPHPTRGVRMGDILKTMALMMSLLLLGCGSHNEQAEQGTAVNQKDNKGAKPRVACTPSADGGIICQ
jgi:hypothetical protein